MAAAGGNFTESQLDRSKVGGGVERSLLFQSQSGFIFFFW